MPESLAAHMCMIEPLRSSNSYLHDQPLFVTHLLHPQAPADCGHLTDVFLWRGKLLWILDRSALALPISLTLTRERA